MLLADNNKTPSTENQMKIFVNIDAVAGEEDAPLVCISHHKFF